MFVALAVAAVFIIAVFPGGQGEEAVTHTTATDTYVANTTNDHPNIAAPSTFELHETVSTSDVGVPITPAPIISDEQPVDEIPPVPTQPWTSSQAPTLSEPEPQQAPSPPTDPQLIVRIDPEYTHAARRARMRGIVVLELEVSSDGDVTDIRVKKALPFGLTESAIKAAQQWKYKPGTVNGHAVPSVVTQAIVFNPE